MRFKGFVGKSYELNSLNVACQKCLNLYYEIIEDSGDRKEELGYLTTTPGLTVQLTLPTTTIRGMYAASNNKLYVVAGNILYLVTAFNTTITIGTLISYSGHVSMSDNGTVLVLVDGSNGYIIDLITNSFVQITDPDFIGADFVVFSNGYFVFNKPNTGQFYWTAIYSTAIDPLDFATAEGSPDKILTLTSSSSELWIFGEKTIEVWYFNPNTDATTNAFVRNQSGFVDYGIVAPRSVCKVANTLFWLGRDNNGAGQIYIANGYLPQRISTFAIEQAIQSYDLIYDAISYSYQQDGHNFYVLNFPNADKTWVYDQTTQLWHERGYTDSNGLIHRHRVNYHVYVYGKNMCADWENGKIYILDRENYTDDGENITRVRVSPHITQSLKQIFYSSFELDVETGVGVSTVPTDIAYDPKIALRWSNDSGHTWSNEHEASLGKIGEYRKRVIWRRLGSARNRVYEIKLTAPVKFNIIGAEFTAIQGNK